MGIQDSAIYSDFGYVPHYTPVALLLCCDSIKDWSNWCNDCCQFVGLFGEWDLIGGSRNKGSADYFLFCMEMNFQSYNCIKCYAACLNICTRFYKK